jgi:hypothetical protein
LTAISFYQDEHGLHGVILRGHTMQKFETFLRARSHDFPDLSFVLKKLERCFIRPGSDPYYRELTANLERANRSLGSELEILHAEKALQKGALALRNAFPNDRLLLHLVTQLDYGIKQARSQTGGKFCSPE